MRGIRMGERDGENLFKGAMENLLSVMTTVGFLLVLFYFIFLRQDFVV